MNKEDLLREVDKMGEESEAPKNNTFTISPRLAGTLSFLNAINVGNTMPVFKNTDPGGLMRVAKQASKRRPKGKR